MRNSTVFTLYLLCIVRLNTYQKIIIKYNKEKSIFTKLQISISILELLFLGKKKELLGMKRQEQEWSQKQCSGIPVLWILWHFTSISPEWTVRIETGFIFFTFRWLHFLLKMSAGLSLHPASPPPSWSPRSCLLLQANLMMAGPQSQKRKNTCGQSKV